jgi:signal transduction histidine kinase/CheY-like chemotaxis protein
MDFNPILIPIRDILAAIRQQRKFEDIVGLILEKACHLANAIHGSFVVIDQKTGTLRIESTYGSDWTPEKMRCNLKVGEGLTGLVAQTGIPYLSGDVRKDPSYFPLFDYVRSELVVPVIVSDEVWGLINLDGLEENAFNETTLNTLTVFAELIAYAITLRLEVDEQDRLQKHLIQSEKLASLGGIIASIAHEINNPLTSILGHASLLTLKRGGAADEASIQAILAESRRTADLVKSLLAFSRKEVGQRQIIGVNDLVEQICSMKKYQLRVSNIQLVTDLAAISYPISVSAQQIHQVLLNLLNNAEQAIGTERHDGVITLKTERIGEEIRIIVRDNGTGISPEVQKMIFDPFFTTKPQGQGTGLGLSIANSIIESHGGNLSAHSELGRGSSFVIELPLAHMAKILNSDLQKTGSLPTLPAGPDKTIRGRVLLVDDEPQILETLEAYLQIQNVLSFRARDGQAGLDLLQKESVDVIVSDIRMPGMDGLEFYRRARELDPRYANSFVFMSGDLVRESTKAFIAESGCYALEKPFSLEVFYRRIEPFLAGSPSKN